MLQGDVLASIRTIIYHPGTIGVGKTKLLLFGGTATISRSPSRSHPLDFFVARIAVQSFTPRKESLRWIWCLSCKTISVRLNDLNHIASKVEGYYKLNNFKSTTLSSHSIFQFLVPLKIIYNFRSWASVSLCCTPLTSFLFFAIKRLRTP